MVINPIVGVYIPIIRIPIKGGMTIPNIATLDPSTYLILLHVCHTSTTIMYLANLSHKKWVTSWSIYPPPKTTGWKPRCSPRNEIRKIIWTKPPWICLPAISFQRWKWMWCTPPFYNRYIHIHISYIYITIIDYSIQYTALPSFNQPGNLGSNHQVW